MKETATQVNERKIRNGLRKQREKIERQKQKVWDRLKSEGKPKPKLRKLYGGWTIEESDDFTAMYSMGLADELAEQLAAEINAEKFK